VADENGYAIENKEKINGHGVVTGDAGCFAREFLAIQYWKMI